MNPSITQTQMLSAAASLSISSIFIGGCLTLSFIAVPCLQLRTNLPELKNNEQYMAKQWQSVYNQGKVIGPFLALLCTSNLVWLGTSFAQQNAILSRNLCYGAAVSSILIAPFTGLVMKTTNAELYRRADNDTSKERGDAGTALQGDEKTALVRLDDERVWSLRTTSTNELLNWWATLNAIRTSIHFPVVALVVAALVV